MNDLVASIGTFMGTGTTEHQFDDGGKDKIDDIENAIECIQHEINRMKTSSFSNGAKIIKMNKQIHVLSAKYIDFNIKVNRHLQSFYRSRADKTIIGSVVDDDTKPFMLPHENDDCVDKQFDKQFTVDGLNDYIARLLPLPLFDLKLKPAGTEFYFDMCSPNEVLRIIRRIKRTSTGLDGVPSKYFKILANYLSESISIIINTTFVTGVFSPNGYRK